MTFKNNTYRNITITSIITAIIITSSIGVAYAADFSGSNTFGSATTATGINSASFGYNTAASGHESTTFGIGTTAESWTSFAIGRCNDSSGSPLFMIGDGGWNHPNCTSKHNVFAILADGALQFSDGTKQTTASLDNSITNEIETWSTLSGIPAGFSDNTDDNTQLDKAGIEALGFVTGSHTVDTGIIQLDVNRESPDPLDCNTTEEEGRIQIVRINNAPPNMYVCVDNDWKKVKLT